MAFMYDIVFDPDTRRHRLEFVNQQYDFLMGIHFDEKAGTYQLNVSLEEANKISKYWGNRDFDLDFWLALARDKLVKADQKWLEENG